MTLDEIRQAKNELEARVMRDGGTERDVAEAAELVSRYIDELERIENSVTVKPFLSGEAVADKVTGYWYD